MVLRLIVAVLALVAIGYSAVSLAATHKVEGICCSYDTQCPAAHHCVFRVGDDCSTGRTGYCEPVPR